MLSILLQLNVKEVMLQLKANGTVTNRKVCVAE